MDIVRKMSVVISSIVGPCVVIVGELFRYPCNHSRFLLSDCNLFYLMKGKFDIIKSIHLAEQVI